MRILLFPALFFALMACNSQPTTVVATAVELPDTLKYEAESHLKNLRQLTFGGDNAEAYFSFNNQMVTFQSNYDKWGLDCDQIFYFNLEGVNMQEQTPQMISTGLGRTTCAYFMPGDTTILFASTHMGHGSCPHTPENTGAYVWPIYSDYDIFVSDLKGNITDTLVQNPGYDAEATVSPKGDKMVFTSDRSGDLELYVMDLKTKAITQVTNQPGYDGGAFFSPDGEWLVFRASRPKSAEDQKAYFDLLKQGLVQPTNMEIYVCRTDGSELRQVTNLGRANWAPYFHPSGNKILFSSNHASERGFPFNIYMIDVDGNNLKQITHDSQFDAFPMFSFDGKKLIFSSNRHNGGTRETNLFIADWVE